ncbi:CcmD family protein [Fulvivirga sediminis]|uniref:CcmD family protein n=1 Tax=Fulvivirga sediminis TaxID=2803949 RepID=A0A937F667_9BACT|nr:CcmD family protein [Fulvivirga sediminis]MBL3654823.1 CcmD family protein [Fulvivirga sediminis]
MKKLLVVTLLIISSIIGKAQDKIQVTEEDYTNSEVSMADQFRAEGKIYVLTGVILLILGGLIGYLIVIDRKVSKIEKQLPNDTN